MTLSAAAVPDAEADVRWRAWQARGAAQDRRRARIMGRVTALVALGLAAWLSLQLF